MINLIGWKMLLLFNWTFEVSFFTDTWMVADLSISNQKANDARSNDFYWLQAFSDTTTYLLCSELFKRKLSTFILKIWLAICFYDVQVPLKQIQKSSHRGATNFFWARLKQLILSICGKTNKNLKNWKFLSVHRSKSSIVSIKLTENS